MQTSRDLLDEKLKNFKYLIASKVTNDEMRNSNYSWPMMWRKSLLFTMIILSPITQPLIDRIITSFLAHLEIDPTNAELNEKLKVYFEFFTEIIQEMQQNKISE